MTGCVNLNWIVCFELPAREAISFCDFWKFTSCYFITFISSFIEVNFFFFMCLLRINLPNLCPNMNHFDAVDFSECHFLLTLSVYRRVQLPWQLLLIWLSSWMGPRKSGAAFIFLLCADYLSGNQRWMSLWKGYYYTSGSAQTTSRGIKAALLWWGPIHELGQMKE